MSEALQFWSALLVPMTLMLATPSVRWLVVAAPAVFGVVLTIVALANLNFWTGVLVLNALVGLGCGVTLRLMLAFVRRL